MALIRCDVLTPYRRLFTGEIESLVFVTHDGEMEVLAGHEPVVAPVVPCVFRIKTHEGEKIGAAAEGFATITQAKVELFLDTAEWSAEIDRERAVGALERAEARLAEGAMSWEMSRASSAAARAKARLAALATASARKSAAQAVLR